MIQFLTIGKSIGGFLFKYWKWILPALIVGLIIYVIYSQKLDIANLTADLVQTQQQLENVKENYATQQALIQIRNEISTANQVVMDRVNEQNRQVTNSLNEIESRVSHTGTEVDKLKMELYPDVADFIDKEIERRGYNNGK